jgi:hypothetical protein
MFQICRKFNCAMMRTIKTHLIPTLIITVAMVACTESTNTIHIANKGKAPIKNGKGEMDTIAYQCKGCTEQIHSKQLFDYILNHASELTKRNLNFPLSYQPKSMELIIEKEDSLVDVNGNKKMKDITSVNAKIKYIAKNAYGNELEGESVQLFYLKRDKVIDISNNIQLPALQYVDGTANRPLMADEEETGIIELTPVKDKGIIVKSTIGCVDTGAKLELTLVNGEKIEYRSWNDFNCDGLSYFYWFNNNSIEKLKTNKVKSLFFYSDGESIMAEIPQNQRDYFIQLFQLK